MSNRIFLLNYGCVVNKAEGEAMAGILADRGFTLVNDESKAEIVIINTCGVKTPTENKILHKLSTIKSDKKVIVTGCLPKIIGVDKIMSIRNVEGVLGPAMGEEIVKAVQRVRDGGKYVNLNSGSFSNLLPCIKENPFIGKIVISQGCLGACNYCATKFARGRLKSYDIDEIVSAIRKRIEEGVKEIWLSSQDNAIYGLDKGSNIVELLESIERVNGAFLVRIGMMNPWGILRILEGIIKILKKSRFFKFIHIPLQSGSNKVLREMNRNYSTEDFIDIVSKLRAEIPKISLETDVIVGYPTESDADFEETLKLINEVKPDFLNISKFYPRPGTPASRLPKLPTEVVSTRSRILSKTSLKIKEERNRAWVGWEGVALVDEIGIIPESFIARNIYYKPIVLKQPTRLGSFVYLRVISHRPNFLLGEVLKGKLDDEEAIGLLEKSLDIP
ncbi:MAG: tRNA (N(6)-L-threonylcarbamoyladenosine(37)-C(2))-methylthiotransferase [Candidatus Brockarchaeota archaeon]|nr:tRNA (N(6)-L-threonylcarbamoyladenosine(37)-C(2))-methylthiotransferase [Candidatus Brockarchaeota archaeon]